MTAERPAAAAAVERPDRRDHLRLALDAGRLGTWRWDMATGEVEWDERLEEIFGFPPGGFDGTYESYIGRLHPDEREAVQATVRNAVATATPYTIEHRIVWPDGSIRWIQGRGDVLLDDAGSVAGTIGCVADVTDRKLAEAEREEAVERLSFLADATAVLSESLDVDETFSRLVALAVPRLADGAVLAVADGDGPLRVAAVRHVDRELEARLAELFTRYPVRPGPVGLGAAFATGRTHVLGEVSEEVLAAAARDDEHLRLLRAMTVGSGLAVPLVSRGRVLGVLGLGTRPGRVLGADTQVLAEELAARAANAAENARLFEQARRAAARTEQLQRAAARLVAAATLEDVADGMLVEGMRALGARSGCLAVVDRERTCLRVVAVEGWDADTHREWSEIPLDYAGPMAEAVRTGQPSFVDRDGYVARWPVLAPYLRDVPDRAWAHVPLTAGDAVIGVLVWTWADDRVFDDHDELVLIHAFAAQAAAALERALLYRTTRTIADALQAGLAPPPPPTIPGVRAAARYRAAGEGVVVGGDFYDFVPLDGDRWLLVVGDVCGRGPSAAALNAQVRYAARALARAGDDPARLAAAVNRNLIADARDDQFCTAVFAIVEPGSPTSIEIVDAGHPPPLVLGTDGSVRTAGTDGPLLGVMADAAYTSTRVVLDPGATLVVVTDGVLEARDPGGEPFDDDRLESLLAGLAGRDADEVAAAIDEAVTAFAGHALGDDLAVVVLQAG